MRPPEYMQYADPNWWGMKDGYLICTPSEGYEMMGMDDLCQYGRCKKCEVRTVSVSKWAICALCGGEVYGT